MKMFRLLALVALLATPAFLNAGGLCLRFMRSLEEQGLEPGSRLHRITERVITNTKTGRFFDAAYAEARAAKLRGEDFISAFARGMNLPLIAAEFEAKIPKTGALIIEANHPFGLAEAFLVHELAERVRPGEVYGLATENAVSFIPEMADRIIPVDVVDEGSPMNRKAGLAMARKLRDGKVILLFPAGHVARRPNVLSESSKELKWKEGAAAMAHKFNTHVVQIYFEGSNSRASDFLTDLHEYFSRLSQNGPLAGRNWAKWLSEVSDKFSWAILPWENRVHAEQGFNVWVDDAFEGADLAGANDTERTEDNYRRFLAFVRKVVGQ